MSKDKGHKITFFGTVQERFVEMDGRDPKEDNTTWWVSERVIMNFSSTLGIITGQRYCITLEAVEPLPERERCPTCGRIELHRKKG